MGNTDYAVRSIHYADHGAATFTVVDLTGAVHQVTVPASWVAPMPPDELIRHSIAQRHGAALTVEVPGG